MVLKYELGTSFSVVIYCPPPPPSGRGELNATVMRSNREGSQVNYELLKLTDDYKSFTY